MPEVVPAPPVCSAIPKWNSLQKVEAGYLDLWEQQIESQELEEQKLYQMVNRLLWILFRAHEEEEMIFVLGF